ncbi:MAG: hypothetical protein WBV85_06565 [Solirubrobacteraceae bacterium]
MMRHSATIQRRSGGWLIRGYIVLLATIGVALSIAVLPAVGLASSSPSIEWINAWNLTPTDATLGAGIGPAGLPPGVYYQFQVVKNTSEYLSEIACPPRAELKGTDGCGPGPEVEGALPIGSVPDGTKGETVTLDLASAGITLKPGTTYHYRVLAAKALQTEDTLQWEPPVIVAPDQTFTTPLASMPAVESESAATVTPTGATLEATINSEDLPQGAYYQFQLVKSTSEYLPELACPEPGLQLNSDDGCNSADSPLQPTAGALPIGFIAKGPEGQSVSQSLAAAGITLQPGTTYHYRVLAVKRVQSEDGVNWQGPPVTGPDHTFTTPIAPVIDSVSLSHLTSSDATLEAQIDTEGLPTTYEFQMWSSPCSKHGFGCELLIGIPLPAGSLLGSFVSQSVSLDLNSAGVTLGGGEYGFSISATNKAGTTSAGGGVFEASPSVVEPPSTTTSPPSGAGQPASSNTGDQPAGSGGSPAHGVTPLVPQIVCLCNCARGCHGKKVGPKHLARTQKLSKALKACEKKLKKQRASCKRQAEKKYAATIKHRP